MKKGITLISLVITIIVMLILAGVGISGSLALIEEAKYAAFINEMKQADEAVYLVIMEGQLEQKTTEEILADIGEKIPEEVLKKISNNLKLEILYARAGFPEDELPIPEDYSEELANFSSEENLNSLFLVNASVAGKEQAYIYDEQSASVYKVEPTIIWGVEMHGYDYGNLLVSRPGLLEKAQGKKEENPYEDNLVEYLSFEQKTEKYQIQEIDNPLTYEEKEGQSGERCGYFAATSAYSKLVLSDGALNFGTNDFTIELWAYYEEQTSSYTPFVMDNNNSNLAFFIKDYKSGNNIGITVGSSQIRINTGVSHKETINQWVHYALVRKDGIFYIYQNGTKIGEGIGYEDIYIDLSNLAIGGPRYRCRCI